MQFVETATGCDGDDNLRFFRLQLVLVVLLTVLELSPVEFPSGHD